MIMNQAGRLHEGFNMNRSITFDEFKDMIFENLGIEKDKFNEGSHLINDLGIDSLSIVNLIIKIERMHNIKIDFHNLWLLKNVGEVYNMLIIKLNEGSNY